MHHEAVHSLFQLLTRVCAEERPQDFRDTYPGSGVAELLDVGARSHRKCLNIASECHFDPLHSHFIPMHDSTRSSCASDGDTRKGSLASNQESILFENVEQPRQCGVGQLESVMQLACSRPRRDNRESVSAFLESGAAALRPARGQ